MVQTLDEFRAKRPDTGKLREQYPELSNLLTGTFVTEPVDHTSVKLPIVSWGLLQGKMNYPTYGMIGLCEGIEVPTNKSYAESVHVLEGKLKAEIRGVKGEYERGKEPLIALPESSLKLTVRDSPVVYFCELKISGTAMAINEKGERIIPFYALNQLKGYSLKDVVFRRNQIFLADDKGNTLKIGGDIYRALKQQDYASGKDPEMDALIQAIDAKLSPKS